MLNEVPHFYLKNVQGDVIGITDAAGNIEARHAYDTWGKLISIADENGIDRTTDTDFIGYINPIRYRGYYYDSETGFYYLNSRYYDPETGRFINADATFKGGLNLFEYCYNNTVNFHDPDGEVALADDAMVVVVLATGATLTMTYAAYCSWLNSPEGQEAIDNGARVVRNVGKGIANAANWVGDKAKAAWNWTTSLFAAEHTKNKRKSTYDKHTKPRPGRSTTKDRQKPNWKPNPNKRRR